MNETYPPIASNALISVLRLRPKANYAYVHIGGRGYVTRLHLDDVTYELSGVDRWTRVDCQEGAK